MEESSSGGTGTTTSTNTSKNVTVTTAQGQTLSIVGKPGQVITTSKGQTIVLSAAPNLQGNVIPISLAPAKPVATVSVNNPTTNSAAVQAILKRPHPTLGHNQVLTKVIITKNPTTNKIVSASVAGTTPKFGSGILQTVDGKLLTSGSPVKVITVTQGSLLNKNIVIPSSAMSKLIAGQTVTPSSTMQVKSPVKTTATTPKKIAPAPPRPQQVIIKGLVAAAKTTPSVTTVIASGVNTASGTNLVMQQNASGIGSLQQAGTSLTFSNSTNLQPIQVAGNKFPYIRLVTVPSSSISTNPQSKQIVQQTTGNKVILSNSSLMPQQYRMQGVPIAPATQVGMKSTSSSSTSTVKRMIMPNRPVQIQPNTAGSQLSGKISIPTGTTLLAGNNLAQNIAVVPVQYIAPVGQQNQNTASYIPISTKQPPTTQSTVRPSVNGGSQPEPPGTRPRKPCNCTRSQCLKLYCDCFANGEFCSNCNCNNCLNNLDHEDERSRAIRSCLERNPQAFHPKIGKGRGTAGERRHNKGCNCKRSGCLKNYCECYEAKILCSSVCKCYGCKNFEESPERKTLMHLADAAEVRVQQQTAAKSKLSQFQDFPSKPPITNDSGERLPYSFITTDVAEATCQCLLAQAEESERNGDANHTGEQLILEEFGRCLMQIIESAGKTKGNGSI